MKRTLLILYFQTLVMLSLHSASAQSGQTVIDLRYEIQWGNMNIAHADARWVLQPETYSMTGNARTVGATDLLYKYRGKSHLLGQRQQNQPVSKSLKISSQSRNRQISAEVVWNGAGDMVSTERSPALDLEKVHPVNAGSIEGSIDPLTAMLRALQMVAETRRCGGSYKIYDGLRTATVSLHPLGRQTLVADRPGAFQGESLKCGVTSRPTGGHRRNARWRKKQQDEDDIVVFIAEVGPQLLMPVRIEVKTMLGKITARLAMPSLEISRS